MLPLLELLTYVFTYLTNDQTLRVSQLLNLCQQDG